MSALLVDELFPGVTFSQKFRITRNVNIAAVRPWVYLHNTLQDGDLQIQVKQSSNLLATFTFSAAEVNAAKTLAFAHGFMTFCFNALVLRIAEGNTQEEYILEFSMINHSLDTDNFIGIVRRWEDKTYPTYGDGVVSGEAQNDSVEPAGLEIFEYKYL